MHSKITNTTKLLAVGALCLVALAAAPAHARRLRAGDGAGAQHRRLGRSNNCCSSKNGCHWGLFQYYGFNGCGNGQYSASRPTCPGGFGRSDKCSECKDCPANTFKRVKDDGCSKSTACKPCPAGRWSAPGSARCTKCTSSDDAAPCKAWKLKQQAAAKATADAQKVQQLEADEAVLKAGWKGAEAEIGRLLAMLNARDGEIARLEQEKEAALAYSKSAEQSMGTELGRLGNAMGECRDQVRDLEASLEHARLGECEGRVRAQDDKLQVELSLRDEEIHDRDEEIARLGQELKEAQAEAAKAKAAQEKAEKEARAAREAAAKVTAAKAKAAQDKAEKEARAQACPAVCRTCRPGGRAGGAGRPLDAATGACTFHCSTGGYCGVGRAYERGGTDCSRCAA